jgi:glycosyltransferase involved in cell wall biosynthesis
VLVQQESKIENRQSAIELSVIVPVYDEAASLPELAERLRTACSGYDFEVWLVDDGSGDDSWSVIEGLSDEDPRFGGVRFRRNYGKSASLAVGFERARGRYVVTLDADLQDDPAEIPSLVEMLRDGGNDLVSGWKQDREDPLSKKIPSRFFNFVTRKLSGIPLHDFNCGLKAYRREVVKNVQVYGELHRYIPLLAHWEGFDEIAEKPVEHHARRHGRTKFGTERFVRGFLDLFSVTFLTRFAARPMHFFGSLGSFAFTGGVAICIWLTVEKYMFGHAIGNRPLLLLGALLILFGAQMFTTGLLGEMSVRREMERTDTFQVQEARAPAAEHRESGEAESREGGEHGPGVGERSRHGGVEV